MLDDTVGFPRGYERLRQLREPPALARGDLAEPLGTKSKLFVEPPLIPLASGWLNSKFERSAGYELANGIAVVLGLLAQSEGRDSGRLRTRSLALSLDLFAFALH